jgi:hypothetical protein
MILYFQRRSSNIKRKSSKKKSEGREEKKPKGMKRSPRRAVY